jgi:hypothetical protein
MRKMILLVFSICCVSGCILPSQQAMKAPENLGNQAKTPPGRTEPSALIKPTISPENGDQPQTAGPDNSPAEVPGAAVETPEPRPKPPADRPANAKELDDTQVRAAAIELAKHHPAVKKMRLCYSIKDAEWWVTLYEPAGGAYELRRFTWNAEKEKLEPFLVTGRVPIAEFDKHVAEDDVGKLCKIVSVNP